jgi:membrane fusion protein (multidrug efflux system)
MHPLRKWLLAALAALGLAVGGYFVVSAAVTELTTVSTDDAYVNGHVTFVAPRVAGQVTRILVDDNYRVKKGDLLVQLDREPFQVQVAIKESAVTAAESDLEAAKAQAYGQVAEARSFRFKLEHAMEDVKTQIANLRANVATWKSKQASLNLARQNLERGEALAPTGGVSKENLDQRREAVKVAEAAVEQALETIYANRVNLGLPAKAADFTEVPADLEQNFSAVRQTLAQLLHSLAQLGIFPPSWDLTPKELLADMYRRDAKGNLDRVFAEIIPKAPSIKQAEARLLQARNDLAQALLNLRYCDVVSEIDGVVTRRNVNPGNLVQVGYNLMAVRSLTEIWIDANFKETQLAELRIGQRVRCVVDMYGGKRDYEGRITGFTMGTGQTLALLPPQNATGNFVKIVQRLPVRIELTDYDPDRDALFVGLSVTPYVFFNEPATGPNAGKLLQAFAPLPQGITVPKR